MELDDNERHLLSRGLKILFASESKKINDLARKRHLDTSLDDETRMAAEAEERDQLKAIADLQDRLA